MNRTPRTYTVTTTDGAILSGTTYASRADAEAAVRAFYRWDAIITSDSFATDAGEAVCCYPSDEDCDADAEGAYAPRIVW